MTEISLRSVTLHLALLGAGATIYAVPILQPQFAVLTFVASLPWLWFILSPDSQTRKWSPVWFLGLIYLIGIFSLNWLNNLNLGAWLISPLFYILLFLPTFYLTRALKATWPLLPLSVIWGLSLTGTEWLRIRLSPGEVPFCQLGASLVHFAKLIQVVDVAGSSALSTLAAVAAGFTADMIVYFFCGPQPRRHARLWQSSGVVLTVFALTLWYGYLNDRESTFSQGARLEVIQTNMPGWRDEAASRLKLQRAIDLTLSSPRPTDVDIVIWPENSVVPPPNGNILPSSDPLGTVSSLARDIKIPILIDGPFDIQNFWEWHRAALVLPDGTVTAYMKQVLVPWSEYAPFEPTLRAFNEAMANSYLTFVKSRNPYFTATHVKEFNPMTLFRHHGQSGQLLIFAAPICYEIMNARLVNQWYAMLDQDEIRNFFLINQVNEMLLGKSVHNQALTFCRLRAVEGRVSVIRAANNGISAAINPNGQVYDLFTDTVSKSATDVAGVFFPRVILDSRVGTIYTRFGDWWPVACLLASVTLTLFGYARKRGWFHLTNQPG